MAEELAKSLGAIASILENLQRKVDDNGTQSSALVIKKTPISLALPSFDPDSTDSHNEYHAMLQWQWVGTIGHYDYRIPTNSKTEKNLKKSKERLTSKLRCSHLRHRNADGYLQRRNIKSCHVIFATSFVIIVDDVLSDVIIRSRVLDVSLSPAVVHHKDQNQDYKIDYTRQIKI
ncbi:unnamed protein product [Acanthoscelides obtectus]|uniref:Uncharacterized protein n=1 Tax=Acanthoscelides obtectus TaxID=200917 RepID=A0A9P0Q8S4_ACAOB|nr:unnamed protein product [Acanthoscelides obtectus]CAK1642263.1 hypothetical protein AOBTE_LOCUS12931 [Acanthoscelides obtectus]